MRKDLAHSELTQRILACAIAVHKSLGPGFLEKVYEEALCVELERQNIAHERQKLIPIVYRKKQVGLHRLDLVIERVVVVELKAVSKIEDIHYAIALSYLRATNLPVALLLNFAAPALAIRRFGNSIFRTGEAGKIGSQENLVQFLRKEGK